MGKMGTNFDVFDVPVCDSFIPKNHEQQLCYEVDLDKFKNDSMLFQQLKSGLVLLLDFNEIRQLDEETSNKTKRNIFSVDDENSFTIHLDTISNYIRMLLLSQWIITKLLDPVKITKEGQYNLNSLKEIKGNYTFIIQEQSRESIYENAC